MSDLVAHQPIFSLKQHSSSVTSCAMDEQGLFPHFLLSGDVDGVVKLWDLELRSVLLSFVPVLAVSVDSNANPGVLRVGFLPLLSLDDVSPDVEEQQELLVYAQCRNRRMYICQITLNSYLDGERGDGVPYVKMLHTLDVPQHGFCAVPCVTSSCGMAQLAIPHDSDGMISLWKIQTKDAMNENFTLDLLRDKTFSCGKGLKCGTIMCMNFRDQDRLAVAFESGHVTLNNVTRGASLAIIRAFAETALVCRWAENTLLVSSAEGQLHCYSLVDTPHEQTEDAVGSNSASQSISLTVLWEVSLRKGLGCVALERNLVLVGSWDHTLRLYDVSSGRVVTILTAHSGAVNDIFIVPQFVTHKSSFGYDIRHPRVCRGGGMKGDADDDLYLFATAGGDYTVHLWRLDFTMLRALVARTVE